MSASAARKKRHPNAPFPWKKCVKGLLVIVFFACIFFSVNKVKKTHEYPIHVVKIYGAQHVNHHDVQHTLMQFVTNGFFAVEVDAVKEQLLQFPWVSEASVWRVWPDQIVVVLNERMPVARWNDNALLSSNGEIFNPDVKTYPANLPQFIGPDGHQIQMLNYYNKINTAIKPLHNKITQLELTPYLAWDMTFENGMKVNLGYKDVLTRINHFVKVYAKIVGKHAEDVEYVDLRYSNGLAVKWKTVT